MNLYFFLKLMFGASFCLFVIDAMPRNRRPQGQQGNQQQVIIHMDNMNSIISTHLDNTLQYTMVIYLFFIPHAPILHPQPPMIVHHPPHPFIPTVQLHPIVQPHPILTHPPPAPYYPSMHQPGPPPLPFLPPGDLAYATHHYHQYQPGWDQQFYPHWLQNNPVQSSMQYPEYTTPHSGESSDIEERIRRLSNKKVVQDDDGKILLPRSLEENDKELEGHTAQSGWKKLERIIEKRRAFDCSDKTLFNDKMSIM
uniref:Uncharacterized protein n=1 Tax=Meloidogyne enterolobii TaxID=390850 RepID=A0A6V7UWJ3_MELEN|nr:unnamed protein product [Meloidogyne enterolobii]